MKKLFLFLISVVIICGCKKDTDSKKTSTVEYQMICSDNVEKAVAYNNEHGQYTSGAYKTGWKYSFDPDNIPFTALVRVPDFFGTASITLKILVNGETVASKTASGDVSVQYTIQ